MKHGGDRGIKHGFFIYLSFNALPYSPFRKFPSASKWPASFSGPARRLHMVSFSSPAIINLLVKASAGGVCSPIEKPPLPVQDVPVSTLQILPGGRELHARPPAGLCSPRGCELLPISTGSCRGQTPPVNSVISPTLPGQAAGKSCVPPGWDQLEDGEMCGVREMCGHTGHGGGWLGVAAQVPPTAPQQPKAFWGPKGSS